MYACPLSSIVAVVVVCCGMGLVVGQWWRQDANMKNATMCHVFRVCVKEVHAEQKNAPWGAFWCSACGGGYARTRKTRHVVAFFVFWWVREGIGHAEHEKCALYGVSFVLGTWRRGRAAGRVKES